MNSQPNPSVPLLELPTVFFKKSDVLSLDCKAKSCKNKKKAGGTGGDGTGEVAQATGIAKLVPESIGYGNDVLINYEDLQRIKVIRTVNEIIMIINHLLMIHHLLDI
ncbi:hypothetical protein DdX_10679 [Ditylenchus destructor]|uniref:Uncharacterized protein n=1 Tax=Ditylenchus destructor TaxID=166010 RepID=A0AAD4MYX1_9BILA|nr:hypothetical protein DdX_10679 [Ditylenchus destructor]